MRAETGSSRPSVWDDRPRIDKAGQNRRSDGWKSDVYCQPRQNGYEDEEQEEQNTWKICGEIVDRVTKIAIRLMRESYGQCMKENIIELLKYLKFELETVNENT